MHLQLVITLFIFIYRAEANITPTQCDYRLVQSMPEGLTFQQELPFELVPTHEVFVDLINNAQSKIQLASFYIQLTPSMEEHIDHPSAVPARRVLEALESAARDRNVQVELILGFIHDGFSSIKDIERLRAAGVVVKHLDMAKLLGSGVQHAKFLIADEERFYLGSANLDWRSLTQVKEMGVWFNQCKELALDMGKIFRTYSMMADQSELPTDIPDEFATSISANSPLTMITNGEPTRVFLSASPRKFNSKTDQRTDDIDAILDMISKARKFVYVSVMNFRVFDGKKYWPVIENALRAAVYERRVRVKIMVAKRDKFYDQEIAFFKSLQALNFSNSTYNLGRLEVKLFEVPKNDPFHASIPFARVKHDKYIITDRGVYFGTSNWEESYFERTCGVGMSILADQFSYTGIIGNMTKLFNRDYYSEYSKYA